MHDQWAPSAHQHNACYPPAREHAAMHRGHNHPPEEEESPLFLTDDFRIWCMKVIPCTKRFVHDWTVCPFAHAGEKAVRRDPRLHQYTGIACPDMKKTGGCIRGERCPYAHNVFEYWLHPTRYRTQLCNDGPACRRGICFFAHSLDELRVPACKPYVSPEALALASLEAIQQNPHPLGVQLAGPAHPLAPHNHAHAAAAQQAALAALNARPGGAPRGPQPYHTQTQPHPLGGGPAPQHPHSAAYPPRISSDYSNYGALPRWSDAGSTRSSLPAGEGYSYDGGGRLSLGDGGGYGGGRQSAPERGSLDAHAEAFQARPYQQQQQQQQQPYPRDQAGPAQFQQHYHPSTLSTSPTHAAAQAQRLGGGRAGPPPPAAPFPPPRSDGSGSGGSPERRSGVASPDGSLAHSLASLKIALAAHNSASSTASNHDIVINALHQILRDAVAQQPGGGQDKGAAAAAGPGSPDAVAAAVSASLGATGFDSGATSEAADTPGRVSLESSGQEPGPAGGLYDSLAYPLN